jgi:hypothetical protein
MTMTALDRLIPTPRLLELDHVDLGAAPARIWEMVRHGDLARSRLIRALFVLRTLPERIGGHAPARPFSLRLDDLHSSLDQPGFAILADDPPREVVVGAIGKVWQPEIPFRHVADEAAYAAVADPGWVKVAWALRVLPRGAEDARVEIEVRVDGTDEESWQRFRRYFRLIGPASRFIRRSALGALARELGTPEARAQARPLPGDELIADPGAQLDHGITIAATPQAIWPWLVQMGCQRAGFYSIDALDNDGIRSAREIHPQLQRLAVGQMIPAVPDGSAGFEVLRVEPTRALVLGGLYDPGGDRQVPFASPRPPRFWQMTWAFVLEPIAEDTTRLHVRARGAFSPRERLHAAWIRPVHALMQTAQLRHLAARAEGRQRSDDWRDVLEGVGGAAAIALALLTPFSRHRRTTWGIAEVEAAAARPGDDLIPAPRWSWTHAIEIDAPAEEVWPWVAQIGAGRGGFYSYQWLENVVGCQVRNAEVIHPEWALREGDTLRLHPEAPPLEVIRVEQGRWLVGFGAPDEGARAAGKPWAAASWLFQVEPLGPRRCRFVSRFRSASSDDLATRLQVGPVLVEPIGFVMDRRMLRGVKERAERGR